MATTYIQIARKLRLQYGPGKPDIVSERPTRNTDTGRVYTDSEDNPTLVTLTGEEVGLNVELLIRSGGIIPRPRHKPAPAPPKDKEGD